jgi:hypothetical protein
MRFLLPLFLCVPDGGASAEECEAAANWPKPLHNIHGKRKDRFDVIDFGNSKGRGLIASSPIAKDSVIKYDGELLTEENYPGGSLHALQISGLRAKWYVEELPNEKTRLWDFKSFRNYTAAFKETESFHQIWIVDGQYADGTIAMGAYINMADSNWAARVGQRRANERTFNDAGKNNQPGGGQSGQAAGHQCRILGGFKIEDGEFFWTGGWVSPRL